MTDEKKTKDSLADYPGLRSLEAGTATGPDINQSVEAPAETLLPDDALPPLREIEEPQKAKVGMKMFLIILVVSLLCSTMAVAVYDRYFAQKVVTINLRAFMEHQRELYLAGKVTADQVKQNLDDLVASVKKAPKNKVVILEDVVANSTEKLESK